MSRVLQAIVLASAVGALPVPRLLAGGGYPSRPIEFVIPFPPGGPADTAARIIQPSLAKALGGTIVLTNKPGAGGALAADYVAKAKPDGYTVFAGTNAPLTILTAMQPDLTYRPSDFAPVGAYMADVSILTTKSGAPWKTLEELVAYARKNPGKLSYGSAGLGTVSFFTVELLKQAYGLDIVHVPFQGAAVKNALLGGHVALAGSGLNTMAPLLKAGDLVGLVTSASKRLLAFPDVPTMAEKGFPNASLNIWMALYVPAKTPREVIDTLWRALATTMKAPAVVAAVANASLAVELRDPAATAALLDAEGASVAKVVARLGIRAK